MLLSAGAFVMAYVDPATVVSPKQIIKRVDVLYNTGQGRGSWSVARLIWDGEEKLGIRWNGDEDSAMGNPQSRGLPTWFVVPDELRPLLDEWIEKRILLQGYSEMAADKDREREALDWSENLISDAANSEG